MAARNGGNNNAYCQDNELSWFDWQAAAGAEGQTMIDFIARLTRLRRENVTLRSERFLGGEHEVVPSIADLTWWDERGVPLSPEDWANHEGRVLILRRAATAGDGSTEITALMLNADSAALDFKLPGKLPWMLLIDSGDPKRIEREIGADHYRIAGHGAVLISARLKAP